MSEREGDDRSERIYQNHSNGNGNNNGKHRDGFEYFVLLWRQQQWWWLTLVRRKYLLGIYFIRIDLNSSLLSLSPSNFYFPIFPFHFGLCRRIVGFVFVNMLFMQMLSNKCDIGCVPLLFVASV